MTFKDEQRALQHLVKEHRWLRHHNRRFKEGDDQADLLLFAEAALILMTLERFVRAILGPDITDTDTLYNLLQRAVSKKLLRLPYDDQDAGTRALKKLLVSLSGKNVRNTLMHGNFELAAREAGCSSVDAYFQTVFAGEVEALYKVTDDLLGQIEPDTGAPWRHR